MDQRRHIVARVAQTGVHVAGSAIYFEGRTPVVETFATLGCGLIPAEFIDRFVRLVNERIEPPAVIVQEAHAPKGQHRHEHKQPNRRPSRAGGRFDFLRPIRCARVGVHLGGALVSAATGALVETAGAFVEAAIATVIGVSKMTVSARKLRRYATSAFAWSVGTISLSRSGANSPLNRSAFGDGSRMIFRFSNRNRYGGMTDFFSKLFGL